MRILIAPREINGQMQLLAEAFRKKGHYATAVAYEPVLKYMDDVQLGLNGGSRAGRGLKTLAFAAWAVSNYDVFHFFYGLSLLPRHTDLPWLKRLGKKVYVHFRGADVLNYENFFGYQRNKLLGNHTEVPPWQSPRQRQSLERWRKHADRLIVVEPELLLAVPEATMVQQSIDLSQWEYTPEPEGESPREVTILHGLHRDPMWRWKKGTDFIQKAVDELKSQGYPVRFEFVEGLPHNEVKAFYKTCHIGIDRVLDGWYGNISIELMALGKPVVAYIDPELRRHRPDLPIVSATPTDLAEKLKPLIRDQALRRQLGQQGRAYVEKWHDVNVIADQLLEIYNCPQQREHLNGAVQRI